MNVEMIHLHPVNSMFNFSYFHHYGMDPFSRSMYIFSNICLILGIIKSVIEANSSWSKKIPTSKYKVFGDYINPLLKNLSNIHLD